MDSFSNLAPLWDFSQAANFSQLPDDDFLALLQKQFPSASYQPSAFGDGINPQNISQYSLPSITPPSEDSSPSPQTGEGSNKQSPEEISEDSPDSGLKRKASDEDLGEGPSQKNPHTASSSAKKDKSATSKRKSSGSGPPKDETRLIKRKEQNRAAQRAFRERKEKHVKDLEDKVAALESKNEQANAENENLRDLLSRLQSENVALKQASFTFSVPKQTPLSAPATAKSPSFTPDNSLFSTLPRITYTAPSNYTNPLDMTSMMSFDPSVLNLLDESPQETATDSAMQLDFGFGKSTGDEFLPKNYTTIASNPAFFSLASAFDHLSPPIASGSGSHTNSHSQSPNISTSGNNDQSPFSFDLSSLTQWPTPTSANESGTLDDLFGGSGFLNPGQPMDVNAFLTGSPSAVSPVMHHTKSTNNGSPSTSASSSPASHTSDPLFSGREGSSSESETGHDDSECPKTQDDCRRHLESSEPSAFVDAKATHNFLQSVSCAVPSGNEKSPSFLNSVECNGTTTFPPVEKSEKNVPVLDAWRNITREYKEYDIANLCTEFASKARCDGHKVVLEPQGVSSLIESLSSKKRVA